MLLALPRDVNVSSDASYSCSPTIARQATFRSLLLNPIHILPFTIPSYPPSSGKSSHRRRCQRQQQPQWRPPPRSLSAGKTTPSLYPFHLPFRTLAPPTAYKTTHPAHPMAIAKPSSRPFRRHKAVQARARCRQEPLSCPMSLPTP